MPFSWNTTRRPIIALAPMAGYTDSAFRQAIKTIAPEIICFSELTSADGLKYAFSKNKRYVEFSSSEKPIILQLFGKKPTFFAEAAKKIEALGAAGIDINMGCPARKVINSCHGSALFNDPDLAAEIVYQTQKSVSIPVSVKTRIGFKTYSWPKLLSFTKKIEAAGAKLLTVHGRTTAQGFSGQANWRPIYQLKKHLQIPIIGNGDIDSVKKAIKRAHVRKRPDVTSGKELGLVGPNPNPAKRGKLIKLDGIMIGRALFHNPWLLAEICAHFYNRPYSPPQTFTEKIPFILKHAQFKEKTKGPSGLMEMRKHLATYIKGLPQASQFRSRLVQIESLSEIKKILTEISNHLK